jgi:hypothetical protein
VVTRWPGQNGHRRPAVSRWPERRRAAVPIEPPAWWRTFDPELWVRPGDDEVRYPAGALMGAEEAARRRWLEARRRWAEDHDFDVVTYLQERYAARRRSIDEGPGRDRS